MWFLRNDLNNYFHDMDITEWDCLDNLIKIFNNDYENVDLNKVIIKDVRPRLEKLDKKNERKFKPLYCPEIKNVMFNPPATIVWFEDGSKTTAVAGHGDKYDKEVGLATCMLKRVLGNQTYREIMDKWCYTADKEMLN